MCVWVCPWCVCVCECRFNQHQSYPTAKSMQRKIMKIQGGRSWNLKAERELERIKERWQQKKKVNKASKVKVTRQWREKWASSTNIEEAYLVAGKPPQRPTSRWANSFGISFSMREELLSCSQLSFSLREKTTNMHQHFVHRSFLHFVSADVIEVASNRPQPRHRHPTSIFSHSTHILAHTY